MINDHKGQHITPSCMLRLSLQKIPSSPILKFLDHDSLRKAITISINRLKKKKNRQNAQFSFPLNLCMKCKDCSYCPCDVCADAAPAVQVTHGGIKEQRDIHDLIVHLVLCVLWVLTKVSGPWL